MTRDRRRWVSTLTEAIPPGPAGQPGHAAGAEIVIIHRVELPEVGFVSMSVPRPSSMMLTLAEAHIKRAVRLRRQLPQQVKRGRWVQPGFEIDFSNETLVYDYFQEAMASVVLLHTALDNYLNEALPADFTLVHEGQTVGRAQIEGAWGITKRLTIVLPQVSGHPSLESSEPDLWAGVETLKTLRDDIGHIHREDSYTGLGDDPARNIFSRLLAVDLIKLLASVEATMRYYNPE